jgi:hypothetical protein
MVFLTWKFSHVDIQTGENMKNTTRGRSCLLSFLLSLQTRTPNDELVILKETVSLSLN